MHPRNVHEQTLKFKVVAKTAEQKRVYGWASVAVTKDGRPVVDLHGDVITLPDLEEAAATFVKEYRQGGEMHVGGAPNDLIASIVFTPEITKSLGIPDGTLPGGWFIGMEVTPEAFAKAKSGDYLMFSIEGDCQEEEIEIEEAA